MTKAFQGIRVIDLSDRHAGAYAARMFGDFGADVILIEDARGHPLRHEPPFINNESGNPESLLHHYVNWNKRSVSGTIEDHSGLIAGADVIVTTSTEIPDAVLQRSPDSVHLSITPHGLDGPLAEFPGNNLTACARVGWSAINRYVDEPPLQLPLHQTGYISGVAGFVGAAAALFRSGSSGHGECVDVSEMEAMANTCAPWAELGLFIGGNRMAHGPNGKRDRGRAGPLWKTQNGAINFGYGDWAFWEEAMNFLDLPELAKDPELIPVLGRNQKDTRPVRDGLEEAAAKRDKWELFHGLVQRRCIAGVVQNAQELLENEHLRSRDYIVSTHIGDRRVHAPGAPAKLSATPWSLSRAAPEIGEHDGDVETTVRKRRQGTGTPDLPLSGIRVLAFTQAWAGTFATQLLGLLGADVVQIESRMRPDVWRGAGAPVPPAVRNPDIEQNPLNNNGMYNTVNLNKRAITLDMANPRGRDMFWRMIPKFDVLADNFSPHVMGNWGVTMEALRKHRKDIIFASVSGYGATGPLAEYPANGATTEPMAGLSSIHGYPGEIAQNTGGLIPDPISGYYLTATILAALNHRQRTGEGQRIDAAMIEAVAVQLGDAMLEFDSNGNLRGPSSNHHPRIAPHNVYRTKGDFWLAIAAETDKAFSALAQLAGINDDRFASMALRKSNESALDEAISKWAANVDADATAVELCRLGIAAARVEPFEEIYQEPNPQFVARDFLRPIKHPESGTHYMPMVPWLYQDTPRGTITHAPCFGQHSRVVFEEELGVGLEEYKELEELGITGTKRLR